MAVSWHLKLAKRYMAVAWKASEESPCVKKQVGAALIDDDGCLYATGYGGDTRVCDPCDKDKYTFYQDGCFAIHAEVRALLSPIVDRSMDMRGFTMFVTHGPCDQCMKYMAYFGIGCVVYDQPYKVDYTKWKGRGIEVWQMDKRII